MLDRTVLDRLGIAILAASYLFWLLAMTPVASTVLFDIVFEMGWFFALLAPICCSTYFFIRLVMSKFSWRKPNLYLCLFGLSIYVIAYVEKF